jgi:TadE-like protein
MSQNRPNTRKNQRGAHVIEAGLVLLPLFGFIFLIMDIAWLVFTQATLQHAVREGVRFATTSQTLPGMAHDASIKTVVQQNAIGMLAGSAGASRIAIRYYLPNTLGETPNNFGGNVVEISAEGVPFTPLGAILKSGAALSLTARSSDRMEPSPGGVAPPRL